MVQLPFKTDFIHFFQELPFYSWRHLLSKCLWVHSHLHILNNIKFVNFPPNYSFTKTVEFNLVLFIVLLLRGRKGSIIVLLEEQFFQPLTSKCLLLLLCCILSCIFSSVDQVTCEHFRGSLTWLLKAQHFLVDLGVDSGA